MKGSGAKSLRRSGDPRDSGSGRSSISSGALVVGVCVLCLVLGACATGIPRQEAAEVYYNLGNAYFELGRHSEAVTAYQHALELDTSLTRASYNLARVYLDTNKFEEAFDVLERLLEQDPENAVLLEALAWGRHLTGDDEEALRIYESILSRNDQNKNALYNGGIILWNNEQLEEAEEYLLRLYDITPGKEDLLLALGRLESELENHLLASEFLEAYTAKQGADVEAWLLLGDTYVKLELYDKSVTAFDKVLENDANNADALYKKAKILLTAIEDIDQGMVVLEQAVTAGFRDIASLRELVVDPENFGYERIFDFLSERNLLQEEPVEEPVDDELDDTTGQDTTTESDDTPSETDDGDE
jgi:tetratricopeptide (TPR) repeat protein